MTNINLIYHDIILDGILYIATKMTELFQNQEPQHFNIVSDQQQDTTTLQKVPDPSETATIQNLSYLSDVTVKIHKVSQ